MDNSAIQFVLQCICISFCRLGRSWDADRDARQGRNLHPSPTSIYHSWQRQLATTLEMRQRSQPFFLYPIMQCITLQNNVILTFMIFPPSLPTFLVCCAQEREKPFLWSGYNLIDGQHCPARNNQQKLSRALSSRIWRTLSFPLIRSLFVWWNCTLNFWRTENTPDWLSALYSPSYSYWAEVSYVIRMATIICCSNEAIRSNNIISSKCISIINTQYLDIAISQYAPATFLFHIKNEQDSRFMHRQQVKHITLNMCESCDSPLIPSSPWSLPSERLLDDISVY